jgi:hypothetical protein
VAEYFCQVRLYAVNDIDADLFCGMSFFLLEFYAIIFHIDLDLLFTSANCA